MIKYFYHYLVIKQSKLFDPNYYLLEYPDVRRSDINPLVHFIKFGWKENRNPSSSFSTSYYLHQYPDVADENINPLIHYIKYGVQEERRTKCDKKGKKEKSILQSKPLFTQEIYLKIKNLELTGKVDIVICVSSNPENFLNCYASIKNFTNPNDYQLNVVIHQQDYSKIDSFLPKTVRIHNHKMEYFNFSKANNLVISKSENDILLLNDDTEVTEGWLKNIQFDSKGFALTGAHTEKKCSGNSDMWGKGPARVTFKPINMFCVFIPRRIIESVGLLNEDFNLYGGEDVDYSIRALSHGFPLIISKAFIKHNKNQSFGDIKNDLMKHSRKILLDKYLEIKPYDLTSIKPKISAILVKNQLLLSPQNIQIIEDWIKEENELIIVHNSLSRKAEKAIHHLQKTYQNFLEIKTPNKVDLAEARSIGFKASKGQFILFIEEICNLNKNNYKFLNHIILNPFLSALYINCKIKDKNELDKFLNLKFEEITELPRKFDNQYGYLFGRREIFSKIPFYSYTKTALDFDFLLRAHRNGFLIDIPNVTESKMPHISHKFDAVDAYDEIINREKQVNKLEIKNKNDSTFHAYRK